MGILLPILTFSLVSVAGTCDTWFSSSKIDVKDPKCIQKCSAHMVDMDTFDCSNKCDHFCKPVTTEKDMLSYIKTLSKGDRDAATKYPHEAIKVYEAKLTTDRLTSKIFGKAGRNDESDAFRHFVWAALLVKEIGIEKANYFLAAHELEPNQPAAEKLMDEFNNLKGTQFAEEILKKEKSLELDQIEKKALTELKTGKLKVLNPSKKKIPDGYYSK